MSDARNLVSQLWRHRDDVDRAGLVPSAPPTYLGQVYSGGSIPTAAGRVYLTRPVSVAVNDVEGSTPAFTPDTSLSVPVLVLGGVATAGQNLLAENVDGRWVAEVLAAACSGTVTVNVKCGGANVASATVTISLSGTTIASGTTNGSGNFATSLLAAAGTYDLTVAKAGFATYTGTFTFSCANATVNVVLPSTSNVISGVVGGCGGNLAGALVTATQGVTTLGTATTNGSGAYSITLSGWSSGSVTVTASKARYANGSTTTTPLACGATTTANITLSPATDYYCDPCGGPVPVYKTIYLTQPWDGAIVALTSGGGSSWSGTGTWTGTGYTDCGSATTSTITITVNWSFNADCSVTLRWNGCAIPNSSRNPISDAFAAGNPGSVATSTVFNLSPTRTNSPFSVSASLTGYMGGGSGTATITE